MSWRNTFRSFARFTQFALVVAGFALSTSRMFSQSLATGGIRGHVTDPSGAAVEGTTVTATSPALLVSQMAIQTDSSGEYKLPDLPIGTYKVAYKSSGFQQFVRENVVLTAGLIRPGLPLRADFTWINEVDLTPYLTGGSYNILRPYGVYTVPFEVSVPTAFSTDPYTANAPGSLGNITLYGFPSQYNGAAFVQNEYLNYPKSSAPINKVINVIVTKRFAGKWGLTTSFSGVRDHQPAPSSYGVFRYPIPQNPNQTFFNEDTTWNWQAKATAYYTLPWKIDASTTFEAYNGLYGQRLVNYTVANSGIASTLGTVTVPVDAYGSESGPLRIVWNMETGREFVFKDKFRLKPYVSILNLLNRADQWSISFVTGPTFLVPSVIDTPRIVRFGAVFSF